MKSDAQLQKDVEEELRCEPCVTAASIGVVVRDGTVTLSGMVPTYAEKQAAERAARRVAGVRSIAEEIRVKPAGLHKRNDTEIVEAVVNALQAHVWVPTDIQATVENGWVSLRGMVTWQFQKEAATIAVRYLAGVQGVSNDITVRPREPAAALERSIDDAVKRNALLLGDYITVEADGGKVTLSGEVRSWAERDEAERLAWSAPGVTEVDDRLIVLCV